MFSNKTLYISDLDGTLLNDDARLSEYTKTALSRMMAQGLRFSVATGRTPATAFSILEGMEWNIPHALLNGVYIYDYANKEYVSTRNIGPETVAIILQTLKRLNITGLMYRFFGGKQTVFYEAHAGEPIRLFMEERRIRYRKEFLPAESFFDVPPEGVTYFTLLDAREPIERANAAIREITGINASVSKDIYNQGQWFLELSDSGASKHNATEYLRRRYGFERVVGFGDNLNDLPLFAACDVKVAPANALDEVKAAADHICETNERDGVVKWLQTHAR